MISYAESIGVSLGQSLASTNVVSNASSSLNMTRQTIQENFVMSRHLMESVADLFEEYSRSAGRALSFEVIGGSAKYMIEVFNPDSGERIRQIPQEEIVRLMKYFQMQNSLIVSQEA